MSGRLELNLIKYKSSNYEKISEKSANGDKFIQKYDSLFQIEVDALQPIAPKQFKNILLNCVDEFFERRNP